MAARRTGRTDEDEDEEEDEDEAGGDGVTELLDREPASWLAAATADAITNGSNTQLTQPAHTYPSAAVAHSGAQWRAAAALWCADAGQRVCYAADALHACIADSSSSSSSSRRRRRWVRLGRATACLRNGGNAKCSAELS